MAGRRLRNEKITAKVTSARIARGLCWEREGLQAGLFVDEAAAHVQLRPAGQPGSESLISR